MMFYTDFQREAMRYVGLAKVHYKNMLKKNGSLGYVIQGSPNDNIYIAKDLEDADARKITLLHECGHIKYNHTSVDMRREFKYVKSLFEKLNKPYSLISVYGGPMGFCNIAMDLEVNSKLLTLANIRYMEKIGFKLCTPEGFDLEVLDSYRDYYIPLIERIPEMDDEMKDFMDKIKDILKDMMKDISSKQKGRGSSSGSGNGTQESEDKNGKSDSDDDSDKDNKSSSGSGSKGDNEDDEDDDSFPFAGDLDDEPDDEDGGNVNEAVRDDENSDNDSSEGENTSSPAGRGHFKNDNLEVKDNCSAVIKNFLQKIVGSSMVYLPDSMKHYNRGSRSNPDGLLYSSIRRRNRTDKKRFGICIDVSGSMNTESIITALGSLKSSLSVVDNNSVVVTWDDYLCEEFLITKVPQKVSNGGGTSMHRGLKYLIDKGCDNIVMYSDFETDIEAMTHILKKSHVNMYSIVVSNGRASNKNNYCPDWGCSPEEWKKYIKMNKDWLLVK